MAEGKIVRVPGVKHAPNPHEWEDEIIEAPRDAPRKAVWVPMDTGIRHWYISRERSVHNLVNAVLRSYMEAETAREEGTDVPE